MRNILRLRRHRHVGRGLPTLRDAVALEGGRQYSSGESPLYVVSVGDDGFDLVMRNPNFGSVAGQHHRVRW